VKSEKKEEEKVSTLTPINLTLGREVKLADLSVP
jgi:hypothetical protein